MYTVALGLLMTCLSSVSYELAGCPPVITNGKLHGILPVVFQKVTYTDIADCGSVSQADLFRRARLSVVQSCHSANDTFSLSDKETGDLVGRVSQEITVPRSESSAGGVYTFHYSFVIECTNRKYRATITQIDVQDNGTKSIPIELYCQKNPTDLQAVYSELDLQLKSKLASLQENVKNYKPF
ncbi:DUF4468 domain-containing protein [Spirosoma flavum]|uniref:DUF4468 domain-containing protein n=1 Tax=Spirosoma flavum TaxID=2048557 RepID=A0ABW6AFE9_9BACT